MSDNCQEKLLNIKLSRRRILAVTPDSATVLILTASELSIIAAARHTELPALSLTIFHGCIFAQKGGGGVGKMRIFPMNSRQNKNFMENFWRYLALFGMVYRKFCIRGFWGEDLRQNKLSATKQH